MSPSLVLAVAVLAAPLTPGDHTRTLEVDGRTRSCIVHIPPQYDASRATPVVLAFHGATMNGLLMEHATGLNHKADEAGFVVVYPDGTGIGQFFLVWNAGCFTDSPNDPLPDDVRFVDRLLEDLATVVQVDARRVYAVGLSNGGMMCYRLAAERSDRFAAIASVAGTMPVESARPQHPVPVLHFHGTEDPLVPFGGLDEQAAKLLRFESVEETVRYWADVDGCPPTPEKADLPDKADDGTKVRREVYGPGTDGAEVVLYVIEGGGHTWPEHPWRLPFLGKTTFDISANDLIWEFFEKHPKK